MKVKVPMFYRVRGTPVPGGLVWIPPGSFTMGSPPSEANRESDEDQHRVTLTRGFYMARYETTLGQFRAIMGSDLPVSWGHTNLPVGRVTWGEAAAYCAQRTTQERAAGTIPESWEYRLPTEAEWEYACRAGTTTRFSFGEDPAYFNFDEYVWCWHNNAHLPQMVGLKKPNPWGLYDTLGNVREWCSDWNGAYPAGDTTDPTGPATGWDRILRGGGWNSSREYCRSANRDSGDPKGRYDGVGFRVVLAPVR
jgi:formylglycine-generating enzyme required for sulfatase activity